jgi:hypothetical protein
MILLSLQDDEDLLRGMAVKGKNTSRRVLDETDQGILTSHHMALRLLC